VALMAQITAIDIDTRDMARLASLMRRAPKVAREETTRSMIEILALLEREIKDRTPVGVGGAAGLRGSITSELRGRRVSDLQGRVFSPMRHAAPVELGTKPHFPPLQPLEDWVHAKFGVNGAQAKRIAFLVARKISVKGTEGTHMFEEGFSDNERQVLNILFAAVDRIIARLGGEG
jgi:hypothetical protein